jgi:IstB-like ATP binding protein
MSPVLASGARRAAASAPADPTAPSVLRADNSGWPLTPDLTPFTISLLVYPIFVLDFLLLRDRPWVRVGLVAILFVALQVTYAIVEPPADAIGTNLPFSEWGTVFPDPRLVAAIVDRITFNAYIIETGTQSYRLATSKTSNRKRASEL